jgi:hypothetical protein
LLGGVGAIGDGPAGAAPAPVGGDLALDLGELRAGFGARDGASGGLDRLVGALEGGLGLLDQGGRGPDVGMLLGEPCLAVRQLALRGPQPGIRGGGRGQGRVLLRAGRGRGRRGLGAQPDLLPFQGGERLAVVLGPLPGACPNAARGSLANSGCWARKRASSASLTASSCPFRFFSASRNSLATSACPARKRVFSWVSSSVRRVVTRCASSGESPVKAMVKLSPSENRKLVASSISSTAAPMRPAFTSFGKSPSSSATLARSDRAMMVSFSLWPMRRVAMPSAGFHCNPSR